MCVILSRLAVLVLKEARVTTFSFGIGDPLVVLLFLPFIQKWGKSCDGSGQGCPPTRSD